MLFNLDPERNEKSLCLPAESCVACSAISDIPRQDSQARRIAALFSRMLTATRKRSRYARYPCVVTSHFCLLWQPVTSCVSSLCLHSWCTITDRIRFVCSPLKSIVDPIRLFVSSVSNRDFRERARVNQTNHIESVQCVQLFAVGDSYMQTRLLCLGTFLLANTIDIKRRRHTWFDLRFISSIVLR